MILFGSRARGDYTDRSDIDVLVVADDLPKDPRESFALLRDTSFVNVNPIGFNTESFLKKLKDGSVFVIEVIEDGKILYADNEFLDKVMNIYRDVRKKYARQGKTWYLISSKQ
uniref:Polymerase beta nucleotidyltransferase domain-containing protein n=1 Tax=Ignisphaera aggregans TaxID=334771 RepID=A0A7C4NJF4_9CREN